VERANRQWKEQTEQWKEQTRAMERILIPLKWQTKGSTTYGLLP
jgi:hypothetical protein